MSYKQYKLEWLQHDLTKELVKEIKEQISTMKDNWAGGAFTEETVEGTIQRNAKAIGQVETLEIVLEYITSVEEGKNDN